MIRKHGLTALLGLFLTSCAGNDVSYDASGVFEATEVVISSQNQGTLLSLDAQEGDKVVAGQMLGQIDTEQLSLQRSQAIAGSMASSSRLLDVSRQVSALEQQLQGARGELERFEGLLLRGAATKKQVTDLQNQVLVLERQLQASREQLESANASLRSQVSGQDAQVALIDDQISRASIKATASGYVVARYMEPGEYAMPGKPLLKVADLEHMFLRAYVTAPQLTGLAIGAKVKVYADRGDKDREQYDGVITWISAKAEFTPKTIQTRDERANLVYAIKIAVDNPLGIIKSGMYGDVGF